MEVKEQEFPNECVKLPYANLGSVTRKINEIKNKLFNVLFQNTNVTLEIKNGKVELDKRVEILENIFKELISNVIDSEKDQIEQWKNLKLESYYELK